jgi:putative inorganic carbon (hco3(-)) transporter
MTTLATWRTPRAQLSLPLAATAVTLATLTGALVAMAPTLIVPAGLLAAVIVATLVSSEVATLVVLYLVFVNAPGVAVEHGAPLVLAAAVPLMLGLPILAMVRRGERVVVTPAFACVLVLLLVVVASSLASSYPEVALGKLRTFVFEGVLLYFLVSNVVRTPAALRRALWTLIAAGVSLALISILQAATKTYYQAYGGFAAPDPAFFIGKSTEPRAAGPVGDANYYGQLLIVVAALALVFAWRGRTLVQRLSAGAATAIIAYAITLTYSRGTGVAFVLLLVLMAFMRFFKAWQVLAMVLAVAALLVAVPSYAERVATLSSVGSATEQTGADPSADQSAQSRSTELRAAANAFVDHPLLGVGPAVFPLYYQHYAEQVGGEIHDSVSAGAAKGQQPERQAHNMIVGQAADLGIAGLLAFCGLLALTIRALIRVRAENLRHGRRDCADLASALLLALVGYLLTGAFLTLAYERYFWLLLGLAQAATSIALRARQPTVRATSRR